jgi:hypothetical protein
MYVKKGEVLARVVTSSHADKFDIAEKFVFDAYKFTAFKPQYKELVLERI